MVELNNSKKQNHGFGERIQSPDLNLIEMLWNDLKQVFPAQKRHHCKSTLNMIQLQVTQKSHEFMF